VVIGIDSVTDMATDIDWLPPGLEQVALRLARADQLTFDMTRLCFEWSKGTDSLGPLDLEQVWVSHDDLNVVVRGIRAIPPLVSMLFSEAVNHLRAAIDNSVFYLVTDGRTSQLTDWQERRIAMPIQTDEQKFGNWVAENRRKGLTELADGTLINRISSLQPFADTTAIASMSEQLAALQGVTPDHVHPLLLLQGYSNADKHRAVRPALTRTTYQNEAMPFWASNRSMRPIAVGDVLETIRYGAPNVAGTNPAVTVERPGNGSWVPPGRELDQLARYVSGTVIPTLVLGMVLTRSLPPEVDLTDTGQTARERIDAGRWVTAQDRMSQVSVAAALEAMSQPPRFLPLPPRPAAGDGPTPEPA
jgi:hypothetical protein